MAVHTLIIGTLFVPLACRSPEREVADVAALGEESLPATFTTARAGTGGIIVEKNVMLPMRDGVRLATDIYRPSGAGKYPVVLIRTLYGSETPEYSRRGQYYVERGYVLAVQDTRGKYDSEGDWYGPRDEGKDGSDAITWLGTRPWSSGKVGMTGPSYMGMVQYLVADQENPYLHALVPLVGPLTLGRDTTDYDHLTVYGSRESASRYEIEWMIRTDGRVNQSDPSVTMETALHHLPLADYPKFIGRPMTWYPFMVRHRYGFWEEYFLRAAAGQWSGSIADAEWWGSYEARYRKVRVPILHISGWYDCCSEPPIKNFQLIRALSTTPLARDNQHLLMGPWPHSVGQRKVGEIDFGPNAAFDPDSLAVRWFDRWLKGENNGIEKSARVRVFIMGANMWRDASDWPIPGTQFTKYFLHSNGDARLNRGGGTLTTAAPLAEPVDRYTYDPGNPTPATLSDTATVPLGPADRSALQKRDDVLVYTSAALGAPVDVIGPLSAVLYVVTSAPSTDFLVRLIDVHANGAAYPVHQLYVTTPFRTHWSKDVETRLDGTRVIKAAITLPPTGLRFLVGHRIRVEVSSAYAPLFRALNVEPGSEYTATKWNVARQTIYHDSAHPSHILLPIVPR